MMVYSMPPGAMRYAYSVMSVVLMMRRRWLAALKCGSYWAWGEARAQGLRNAIHDAELVVEAWP